MGIIGILALSAVLAAAVDKKVEEVIASVFISVSLALYALTERFGFRAASTMITVFLWLSVVAAVVIIVRSHKNVKKNILTIGAIAFVIYVIFLGWFQRGRDISGADDFTTWALLVKQLLFFNTLHVPESIVWPITNSYPPLVPLWNTFFYSSISKFFAFSGGIILWAESVWCISMIIPVLSEINIKSKLNTLVLVTCVPMLFYVWGESNYTILTPDYLLGAMMCFCVYNIYKLANTQDKFYIVSIILSSMGLCLSKRIGVVFATLMLFLLCCVCREQKHKMLLASIVSLANELCIILWLGVRNGYLIIPVCGFIMILCTNYVLDRFKSNNKGESRLFYIVFGIVIVLFMLRIICVLFVDEIENYTIKSFIVNYGLMFGYAGNGNAGMPEYSFYIPYGGYILLLMSIALFMIHQKQQILSRLMIAYSLGMIGLNLFMIALHVLEVGPANRFMIKVISRYTYPCIILATYLLLICIIKLYDYRLIYYGLLMLLIMTLNIESFVNDCKHPYVGTEYTAISGNGITTTYDDTIMFVDENPWFYFSYAEFGYDVFPTHVSTWGYGRVVATLAEMKNRLADCDYLYLQSIDDDFALRYGMLFEDADEIYQGRAYYVHQDNEDVRLSLIGE